METTCNRPQLRRCGDVGRIALYKAAMSSHLDGAEGLEEPLNRQIPRGGVRTTACCCCCNVLKLYILSGTLVSDIILVLVISGTIPRGYHHPHFFVWPLAAALGHNLCSHRLILALQQQQRFQQLRQSNITIRWFVCVNVAAGGTWMPYDFDEAPIDCLILFLRYCTAPPALSR